MIGKHHIKKGYEEIELDLVSKPIPCNQRSESRLQRNWRHLEAWTNLNKV